MQLWNELYCDTKKFLYLEQIHEFLPRVAEQ